MKTAWICFCIVWLLFKRGFNLSMCELVLSVWSLNKPSSFLLELMKSFIKIDAAFERL